MAEKRKPAFIILLKFPGKKFTKIELFNAKAWGKSDRLFRLRVKGKWWPDGKFKLFYKGEIRSLIFKSINI